jgi:hypothetical protein
MTAADVGRHPGVNSILLRKWRENRWGRVHLGMEKSAVHFREGEVPSEPQTPICVSSGGRGSTRAACVFWGESRGCGLAGAAPHRLRVLFCGSVEGQNRPKLLKGSPINTLIH